MRRNNKYKIAIFILSALVILEGVLLIKKPIKKPLAIKGKIAIVIDDLGYNLRNLELLKQIKYPLTVSLLPKLNYSRVIAEELHQGGKEIILHLPLEPHEKFRLEQDTIMTGMDEKRITSILTADLKDIPYLAGVSNHMGSKATEDPRLVGIIFKELKKKRLYFLDSFVSSKSVCEEVAETMQLAFAERDIFLDNKEDPDYIRAQISKLKIKAKLYGQAVGIGHDRRVTLETLAQILPGLEEEGFRLVYISELARK